MIDYEVAYRREMGAFVAQVIGFPEASAFAPTLGEARANLHAALRQAAESLLRRGAMLPIPGPAGGAADAYLVERVRVVPAGGDRVRITAGPT